MLKRTFACLAFPLIAGGLVFASASAPATVIAQRAPAQSPLSASEAGAEQPSSEAERIVGIRKLLEADQSWLAELLEEASTLDEQFEQAAEEFARIDKAEPTPDANQADAPRSATWQEARGRFDRVIARRKAVQQQIATLREKITLAEGALKRLTSSDPEAPSPAEPADGKPLEEPINQSAVESSQGPETATSPAPPTAAVPTTNSTEASAPVAESAPAGEATRDTAEELDGKVAEARRALGAKVAEVKQAEQRIELVNQAIATFERDLETSRALAASSQNEADAAQEAVVALDAKLEELRTAGASEEEIAAVAAEREQAQQNLERLQNNLVRQLERINESTALLERLRVGRDEATAAAQAAVDEAAAARERLRFQESPLAPHRVVRWLTSSGPKILVILLIMLLMWIIARIIAVRVIGNLARRSRRGSQIEREGRAETLRRVFQSAAGIAILIVGCLAALDQAGIDVTVLLGGAAVIGAAIAFGAQNLIKDYYSGFMILVENQYVVGNVVRIGDTSGVVEDISLRTTVLRDEEGVLHFIPHSQVTKVSNLTHGWSRAVFKIPISYSTDVDHVMEVLMDLAREMRDDETFGPRILGEPEMQGVDSFGDSAVNIKFLIKTRPLQQWSVKREMLRRIKKKFDKLGIEIPYPQQTIQLTRPPRSESPNEHPRRNGSHRRDEHLAAR